MKKRWIVFGILIFVLLMFVPVINGGEKVGWLKVWVAYPAFVSSLAEVKFWDITLLSLTIIVLHIGLSAGLGLCLDRLAIKIETRQTANTTSQPIAAKRGSG